MTTSTIYTVFLIHFYISLLGLRGENRTHFLRVFFEHSPTTHPFPHANLLTAWGGDCWHYRWWCCCSHRSPSVMRPDRPNRRKYCCGSNRSAADRAPVEIAVASVPHCYRTVVPFLRAVGQRFPRGAMWIKMGWKIVIFFLNFVKLNDNCYHIDNRMLFCEYPKLGFSLSPPPKPPLLVQIKQLPMVPMQNQPLPLFLNNMHDYYLTHYLEIADKKSFRPTKKWWGMKILNLN